MKNTSKRSILKQILRGTGTVDQLRASLSRASFPGARHAIRLDDYTWTVSGGPEGEVSGLTEAEMLEKVKGYNSFIVR